MLPCSHRSECICIYDSIYAYMPAYMIICEYIYIYAYMLPYMIICEHICIHLGIHQVCQHISTYANTYAYMLAYMHRCYHVCIDANISLYIYICIHATKGSKVNALGPLSSILHILSRPLADVKSGPFLHILKTPSIGIDARHVRIREE